MKSNQQDKLARRFAMAKETDIKDTLLKPGSMGAYITAFLRHREDGVCPFCELPVNLDMIVDEISVKEFKLSGLCQKCQDNFFGV